jgi:hypothetical protein
MDITEELRKLNDCLEDYITPKDKHKILVEARILIEVYRDDLEETITEGIFPNSDKPLSFKDLIRKMENDFCNMKDYNHRVFPDWMKEIYLAEISEKRAEL